MQVARAHLVVSYHSCAGLEADKPVLFVYNLGVPRESEFASRRYSFAAYIHDSVSTISCRETYTMTTSTVELHALTSASLGPDDSITLYENPYTALEKLQDASKGKEIESPADVDDVDGVDWRKYDPPTALRKAPTIKSRIILEIVFSSIENVKTRIKEEERLQKEAAEEAERRTAEEKQKAKGKEPYLPIIIPIEDSPAESSSNISSKRTVAPRTASDFMMSGGNGLPAKGEKRRKFGLRNIFQRSPEGGETSAAGRSREALRHKLESKILSLDAKSADPKTQEAIAALRKSRLFKAADPNELV